MLKKTSKLAIMSEHLKAREKLWERPFTIREKITGYFMMSLFIKKSDIEEATQNIKAGLIQTPI